MMRHAIPVLIAAVLALSSCALIHHDSPPAALIDLQRVRLADDIHLFNEDWPSTHWWTAYNDPQLDALIDKALSHSPGIAVAKSRVTQARADVDVLRASTDLQVALTGSVDRQHVSDHGFLSAYATHEPSIGADGPTYTDGLVGISGRLDIDVWGKQRANILASIGAQNADRAEEASAELELAADVAQVYFSMQVIWQEIALLQQSRDLTAFVVAAHQGREDQGLEGGEPREQANASLAAIDRQLSAARQQVIRSREAMRALCAVESGELTIVPRPLPSNTVGLPKNLSYELLSRRPDLQALRWTIEASFDRVDAAKASFYPSFDITAFFGFNALKLSDLFTHASQQINFIPGLSLPVFDGGRLNANLQSVRSASNALIEQYNQAVLNAVRDIAQTGSMLQDLERESELQAQKVRAVSYAQDRVGSLLERGLADQLAVSQTRLPVISERIALLDLAGQQLAEQIALVKDLGGGYRMDLNVLAKDQAADH